MYNVELNEALVHSILFSLDTSSYGQFVVCVMAMSVVLSVS